MCNVHWTFSLHNTVERRLLIRENQSETALLRLLRYTCNKKYPLFFNEQIIMVMMTQSFSFYIGNYKFSYLIIIIDTDCDAIRWFETWYYTAVVFSQKYCHS